ncbi:uncharacterized protein LOC143542788 [Bidens hawaiensis]|uniref:uncharacterized protein LOC143542788 n=1 Tax=Bidens hawaiensis TaxID=980011 RepID=UPI00404A399E
MELSLDYVKYQPEHNPEAIIKYASDDVNIGRIKNPHVKETILKAKKHLAALGWSFFYYHKTPDRRELRYRSPAGRTYCSLRTACLNAVHSQNTKKPEKTDDNRPKKKIRVVGKDSCKHAVQTQNPKEPESKPGKKINCFPLVGKRPKKMIRLEDFEESYFRRQKDGFFVENNENEKIGDSRVQEVVVAKTCGTRNYFKPKKLIRKVPAGSGSSTRNRRCVLSLLIEEKINIIGFTSVVLQERRSGFGERAAHAGSTIRRPAANIFLDDGRSILDCQTLLQHTNKAVRVKKTLKPTKSLKPIRNDDFCTFCLDGGELVLCDSCTSSFHLSCIGLSRIPDSDHWFCPSCCCGICHEGDIGSDGDSDNQIKCGQCDRKFHVDCLKS